LDRGHIDRGAEDGSFSAVAVVAADIDDECIVELALVFDFLNDSADFMVGVGRVGCKNVRLTNEKFLLVGTERLPFLKLRSAVFGLAIRPRRKLGIRRDDAEPFLVGEDRLAQLFPALIESCIRLGSFMALPFRVERGDTFVRLRSSASPGDRALLPRPSPTPCRSSAPARKEAYRVTRQILRAHARTRCTTCELKEGRSRGRCAA
jgi:hypothetical protein